VVKPDEMTVQGHKDNISFYQSINGNDVDFNHTLRRGGEEKREQCCETYYMGADKSLARPGRKQSTATEDFDVHISYLLS